MLHNRLTLLGGDCLKETTLKVSCLITPCIISFSAIQFLAMQKQWNVNGKLNPFQNTNIDTKTDLENKCHVSTGQARTLRANKAPWNVFICASEPHSSLFVESSTFPLLSAACSELQVSSSPLIASATLHHPPTWQQNMFVLELLSFLCGCPIPHPPHLRCFTLSSSFIQ